jgi:3-hydroxybutyryl-CoA dehydrogenase
MSDFSLNNVLIIGAGTMGKGIAQWFAQQNCHVALFDLNQSLLEKTHQDILNSWEKLLQKGKFSKNEIEGFKTKIKIQKNLENIPNRENIQLVVEAIIEKIEAKKELFDYLDKYLPENVVFSSNTSSFPINSLSDHLPNSRQKIFLGLHFFNPAPIMKLVEIIKSETTEESLIQNLKTWFERNGKRPAICQDRPGFIVNRVARNFYGEPLRILNTAEQNKIKEIDSILKEVGGFKMGPFELMDLIGIDVNLDVTKSVWNAFHKEERFAPHKIQEDLVEKGHLGKKSKEAFYKYD